MKQRMVKAADFIVINTETSVVYDERSFNSGTNVPPYHMAVRKKSVENAVISQRSGFE